MIRVGITGNKGFIGSHVVNNLRLFKDEFKIIDFEKSYYDEDSRLQFFVTECDVIIHLAAINRHDDQQFLHATMALLPLASAGLIHDDVHVSAVTGSTGAGQSLSPTGHFSWRSNNISIYKAFTHQHLTEIGMVISSFQGAKPTVNFIPYRGTFTRGIMANVYTKFSGTLEEAKTLYQNYYAEHPFTHTSDIPVDVKQVVNTNKCLISLEVHEGNLLITSVIDNLTKGASGQAVQNMNLMFGLEETAGLKLKSVGM